MRYLAAAWLALALVTGCRENHKAKPVQKDPAAVALKTEVQRQTATRDAVVVEAQTMVLRQVLVEVNDPAKAYELKSKELAKQLGARLLASGWLAALESQVPNGHRVRRVEAMLNVSYDVTPPEGDAKGSLVVAIEVTLEFIDDRSERQPRVALIVEKTLLVQDEAAIAGQLNALARAALDTVADELASKERLRRASHEELLSQLSLGDNVGMKIWGLQLAADRSLAEAVPAGIQALSNEDEDVRAAAIAMLVSLGGPDVVSALAKNIDFKDHEELRMIMEAVSAIGGEDAEEFLEFVATGHPDEDIRAHAKESIKNIR
jgi:hypothetical protein